MSIPEIRVLDSLSLLEENIHSMIMRVGFVDTLVELIKSGIPNVEAEVQYVLDYVRLYPQGYIDEDALAYGGSS